MNQDQYSPESRRPVEAPEPRDEERSTPPQRPVRPPQPQPPIQERIKSAWVTYAILAITVFVYLVQLGSGSLLGYDLPAALGMKVNAQIARGEFWRLLTPMLLHGSILHIGFNMYALNIIGPELERHYGHGRFIALYLISGFAGNVLSMIFSIANSLGASTAIFGLFGAQGVFIYQNRELIGGRARLALNRIITLAIINLVIGLSPGIDNWGHLGGLVGGVLFSWFAGPLITIQGIYPAYSYTDQRSTASVVLAVLGVGSVFTFLAAAAIIFWV